MNQDTTMNHDDQLAIVLGQRQLVAVCCMVLVVIGLVSTLSYVAGRSITAAQFRETDQPGPPPIMVDPTRGHGLEGQTGANSVRGTVANTVPSAVDATAQTITQAALLPAATTVAKPSPFAGSTTASADHAQATPAPLPTDLATLSDPPAGQTFYQVGAVEKPTAAVFADYLANQGFRIRLAPGATQSTIRVLVGPLANDREAESARSALQAAGFQHFLRRF